MSGGLSLVCPRGSRVVNKFGRGAKRSVNEGMKRRPFTLDPAILLLMRQPAARKKQATKVATSSEADAQPVTDEMLSARMIDILRARGPTKTC